MLTKDKPMKKKKPLPTIWEVPDELWERMEPLILEQDPPKETGRPRVNPRNVMDAIIFRIRTGCQWNHIPRVYGDDASIHRTFQRWVGLGLFEQLWAVLVEECDEFGLVDWEWQAADGAMGKARMGGDQIGPNPTDRAKNGSKKSILTDRQGGPLAIVVAGANVVDAKLLHQTIEAIVVERPKPTKSKPQHLCLDKGYDNPSGKAAVEKHKYTGHIRRIGEEKLEQGKKNILRGDGLSKGHSHGYPNVEVY
jgi:putative transposase